MFVLGWNACSTNNKLLVLSLQVTHIWWISHPVGVAPHHAFADACMHTEKNFSGHQPKTLQYQSCAYSICKQDAWAFSPVAAERMERAAEVYFPWIPLRWMLEMDNLNRC